MRSVMTSRTRGELWGKVTSGEWAAAESIRSAFSPFRWRSPAGDFQRKGFDLVLLDIQMQDGRYVCGPEDPGRRSRDRNPFCYRV